MRVAFDLDGTLIDSLPHIHASVQHGLADRGLPAIEFETIRAFVGNGLAALITRCLDHLGVSQSGHGALSERVLYHYVTIPSDPGMVFPGVPDALDALKAGGHALAICTNKPFSAAIVTLDQTRLLGFFDLVIGGDSLPTNKPHPGMLRACAPDLFVGDSEVDAETAQSAGTPFLLFTEGYRKGPVSTLPHRAAFADYADLPGLVAG